MVRELPAMTEAEQIAYDNAKIDRMMAAVTCPDAPGFQSFDCPVEPHDHTEDGEINVLSELDES